MIWKYERALSNIEVYETRFAAKLSSGGSISVPRHIRESISEMVDSTEMVLVVRVEGIMIPPKKWIKVKEEQK